MTVTSATPSAAVVSRPLTRANEPSQYLRLLAEGAFDWTVDPSAATAFPTMREATRAAIRLPSETRAFALPFCGAH